MAPAGILEVGQGAHSVMLQIPESAELRTQAVGNLEDRHNLLATEAVVLVDLMVEQAEAVAEVRVVAVEVPECFDMPHSSAPVDRTETCLAFAEPSSSSCYYHLS